MNPYRARFPANAFAECASCTGDEDDLVGALMFALASLGATMGAAARDAFIVAGSVLVAALCEWRRRHGTETKARARARMVSASR